MHLIKLLKLLIFQFFESSVMMLVLILWLKCRIRDPPVITGTYRLFIMMSRIYIIVHFVRVLYFNNLKLPLKNFIGVVLLFFLIFIDVRNFTFIFMSFLKFLILPACIFTIGHSNLCFYLCSI